MNANADFKTIVRMREEALHERNSMIYEAKEEGIEIGMERGVAKEQRKAIDFMRKQGISEEVIQSYLAQKSAN